MSASNLAAATAAVNVENVRKVYHRDSIQIPVLEGINLAGATGRVCRSHGTVGLRQDDAAEPDRRH